MVTPINRLVEALRDTERFPSFSPDLREATALVLEAQVRCIADLSLPQPMPDKDVELERFKQHFPLSVWYAERNGFTNPIYTYGFAGWLAKCEDSAGIVNYNELEEE